MLFQFAGNQKFAFWPFGKTTHNILEMMPIAAILLRFKHTAVHNAFIFDFQVLLNEILEKIGN